MHRIPGRILLITAAFALFLVPVAAIAAGGFDDVSDGNVFKADIEWLADAGVTKGCNPPANTKFCPGDNVTREQMAAFMHRLAANQVVDAGTVQGMTAMQLKGQKGDTGPAGSPGADGAAGPAGSPGADGTNGTDGTDGTDGADGVLPDGTPPVGTTARGAYALGNDSAHAWDSIGWGFEMPGPPAVHFLSFGSSSTTACPGTPADPQAAEGNLCVYEAFSADMGFRQIVAPGTATGDAADLFGAIILGEGNVSATDFFSYGTWAVTVGTP